MPADYSGPNRFARDLFGPLPARYDRLAEILSFGQNGRWRSAMVEKVLAPEAGGRAADRGAAADALILDVASGTAGVALQLAEARRAQGGRRGPDRGDAAGGARAGAVGRDGAPDRGWSPGGPSSCPSPTATSTR